MGFSDLLGKRQPQPHTASAPAIAELVPAAALPGGEVRVSGTSLTGSTRTANRPRVLFGVTDAELLTATAPEYILAKVPEESGTVSLTVVNPEGIRSNEKEFRVAVPIADGIHAVANPAVDLEGNIYTTLSGPRGEDTPVSVFKIDTDFNLRQYAAGITNSTGLAIGPDGQLYVSSRNDGSIHRVAANGTSTLYAQGMGIATGIAFDREGNLFAGDRSGTIFKISRDREIYVFATLEPSVAAYHLAFDYADNLYVTAPTTTSYDPVYSIDPDGQITEYYRGLGRPQGIAFDSDGNLYVSASLHGTRGIVRITPKREAALVLSGNNLVGLAFTPTGSCILATSTALYQVSWSIRGKLPAGA
ncbi:MAG: gluconolaconase [Acidobacteriales bacterium]|nr:gluconolaconase [Terriglobales bacterium]